MADLTRLTLPGPSLRFLTASPGFAAITPSILVSCSNIRVKTTMTKSTFHLALHALTTRTANSVSVITEGSSYALVLRWPRATRHWRTQRWDYLTVTRKSAA